MKKWSVYTLAMAALGYIPNLLAQDISADRIYQPTQSDIGGAGLMQTPTGRMNRDGEFSVLYYDNDEYRRMALSLQLFPWLESTIRYTDVRTRLYSDSEGFSGDQTYKDRGLDVKIRLLEETRWLPETSLGLRDIAGTGQFASEFIAASKRFGPVDVTLGIGWGYLGRSGNIDNPLCDIADRFCDRANELSGEGGEFEIGDWFTGNAGVFGGIEYQTPWDPLIVKVEYDANDFSRESSRTPIIQDSHWNYGLHYRMNDNVNLKLSYERGNTWMFGFSFRTNFDDMTQYKRTDPVPAPTEPQLTSMDQLDTDELRSKLRKASGFYLKRFYLSDNGKKVTLVGNQSRYRYETMSLDRAAAVLANYLPASVTQYQFVDDVLGMPIAQVNVDAPTFKRAFYRADFTTRYKDSYELVNVNQEDDDQLLFERASELGLPDIGFRPYLEQSFGGPEAFYMYKLRMDGYFNWVPAENFLVNGVISGTIVDNYDKFNYLVEEGEAPLPRVRTYVREYSTQSDIVLTRAQGTYVKEWQDNLYSSFYGGYLERMFGGIGTEWLYRPLDKPWAVGVDINYARQRSFENHLGFRDYDVLTGHLTGYLRTDYFFDNTLLTVSAGRFLAKDWGVNFKFEKKFDSGIIVGAFAAKTNISAEEFGEGSFNKGFFISIPFDLLQINHSTGRGAIGWTPLTRDGGQMLQRAAHLYGITDARSRFYNEW
ncbi:exopolysaccharide biosynthesis protein YbjH [Idiomarina fontislapidosi]|uniref:YjbH domain-containing protein n=1 Tax=Idiomarina fontislapidosi TaxID=263723 RepID=A0A432XQY6_9GAMM|nr:YjbH domain-containing protein [Idiomarina fontislapidosi]PYE30705.1 exopolysaccharide biosynthesis protein YbjH [Idiomarina fontislapidosi]RUO51127.1 YjbH domain-containing protein [Idiomarina fontislapidosi]